MATSMMLLQATPPRALTEQKNQVYTMLQAPSIGGVRRFGAARRGYGVCSRRRGVLIGFRVQNGLFTLPGTKKVKKDESEDPQDTEADVKVGTRKSRKLPGTMKLGKGKKDNNVVFVAGATGKVGRRVVRELVESGFQVRAGVRDISKGQALLEMLGETKPSEEAPKSWAAKLFKPRTPSKSERIELVECDLEKDEDIEDSLGNAGVVVCAIGASEKEVLDTTGPYRIDFKATVNLVEAATSAKVNHFILVTSLGTTKFGWPASVLNLFWGVLIWKAKAEKALEESGLPYTIVRPGGMEKPTDAYKETHNLVLAPKDTYSGGQVSSLQVAELIATCVSNLDLAKFKVLEAIAETTAPLRPIEDLLAEVPAVIDDDVEETRLSEPAPSPVRRNFKLFGQQEEKSRKKAEADEKKKTNLQEKSRKAAEADQTRKKELLARYERDLLAAREEEEEAKRKAEEALSLKAQLEKRTADLQVQARTAAREVKKAKALEIAMVKAARQGRRLSEKEKVEVLEAAAAEFDGESKSSTDIKKVTEAENKTTAASTNSKPEKGLKFKAMQAAKLKEADDRAAKKFAENSRIAEQAQAEKAEKERDKREEVARLENETKAKAEAEAKAQAEQEENNAKAKAEAEANAQAEKDRAIKDEAEAKAKEDAEATARSKQEAVVDKGKKAKEEAATRAAIALEKAKGAAFRWPWQKRSIKDDEPLETPVLNKSLKEDEDAPLQVDSKPENEDARSEVESEPEASTS